MPSPLLVTGGAGFIGSHTVQHLLELGEKIIVLGNLVYGHRDALDHDRVTLIEGGLNDADLLDRVFAEHQPEAVLHFAAFCYVGESVEQPLKYYRNNVAGPLTLLEAMARHSCSRFIFSSTCATYGNPVTMPMDESHPQNPVNPYGASKLMLERILADCDTAFGLKSVFLRYFNASGCDPEGRIGEDHDPETHLIPRILMAIRGDIDAITVFGTDYPTPDGTCIRDYIHVEDLIDAHVLCMNALAPSKKFVFNLGIGKGYSVREIIAATERVTGKKIKVIEGLLRHGDPPRLFADPGRTKRDLGWSAKITRIDEIVDSAWKWFSRHPDGYASHIVD